MTLSFFEDMRMYHTLMESILAGEPLQQGAVEQFFAAVLSGEVEPVQLAAFLAAVEVKGLRQEELEGACRAVLAHASPFSAPDNVLDVCGTGGDGLNTFNVSTAAAVVCAACGVVVAKHGNRAATSRCGSFDVLEAAGVFSPEMGPEAEQERLARLGICFLFAPHFHPSMRHAAPVRKQLGFPTIFNRIGPLVNPARPAFQMIGVARQSDGPLMRACAVALGAQRVVCVRGEEGLDEVSVCGRTYVWEYTPQGGERAYTVAPREMGVDEHPLEALAGGDAHENGELLDALFCGSATSAQQDFVLANAGMGLYAAGAAADPAEGVARARQALASGAVQKLWEKLKEKNI